MEALKILDQPASSLEWLYHNCHRIVDGNLHGFHLPSPTKRLFRAFSSSDSQPWPNNDFRLSSQALACSLHDILTAIVGKLKEMSGSNDMKMDQPSQHLEPSIGQQKRKRKRRSELSPKESSVAHCQPQSDRDEELPATKCPLDYFFYHNRDPQQVNCSEHVDRGALICVCLSSASSGLEVQPRGETHFVCPEASLIYNKSLYEERTPCSGLICIMAGDQLGALVGIAEERLACVHRVRNNLARARLSISYELRV